MTGSRDSTSAGSAAGIKDIAIALGVSIGTVDRALHKRPGISPLTEARVLKMAQTLGYRPNFAARHLRLNRKLRLAVHLPSEIASFFNALRDGIEEAARPFQSSIDVQFRTHPRLGENDVGLFAEALERKTNGIILVPGHPGDLRPWIRKAARAHIPVVCVATDAPRTERLTSISSDPYSSGALVAELLTRFSRTGGETLVVTGDLDTFDHAEKFRGFREFLAKLPSALRVGQAVEAHDSPEEAFRLTTEWLERHPDLGAVYVSTSNSIPVLRALENAGRLPQTPVITTDLFPALASSIRSGKVLGTIYQRPRTQGRLAFQALYQFLVEGTCPPNRHLLAPHLILRSNLDLFHEMVSGDLEEPLYLPRESAKRVAQGKKKL